jgi:pimeloyl-ACP methyl ester carboxylesterase
MPSGAVRSDVPIPARLPDAESSRARQPDGAGFVERDGVRIWWESAGSGEPALLLMPTWSLFPARHWKFQVPFLSRSFRVLTFDGRGNGRSDRPQEPAAYADTEFAADAQAVLDAAGVDRAVVCGLSMGAGYAVRFAVENRDRALGLVLIGPAIAALDRPEGTPDERPSAWFDEPRDPEEDGGWGRYNAHFWRRDWMAFADWFVGTRIFSEAHSTKQVEDGVGWAGGTDPDTMVRIFHADYLRRPPDWPIPPSTEGRAIPFLRRVECPALVIHGTEDRIISFAVGARIADELSAPLLALEGAGHAPSLRDPVRVNLAIRDFARGLGGVGR